MKIRTVYFKVRDIDAAADFWAKWLQVKPHKNVDTWREFWCGTVRLALLQAEQDDVYQGSGCVPVFEFDDHILTEYIERAKALGATILIDGLDDPDLRSLVMRDPFGHEFEISKFHD
jgi:catechol 2,3-dioxygenase-like lactoylglutathione lyase family enzyme